MPTSIITTDDLREFKLELLEEFEELLSSYLKKDPPQKMVKVFRCQENAQNQP